MEKRRTFSREFKLEAVKLITERNPKTAADHDRITLILRALVCRGIICRNF